jgi:hypothetical protein
MLKNALSPNMQHVSARKLLEVTILLSSENEAEKELMLVGCFIYRLNQMRKHRPVIVGMVCGDDTALRQFKRFLQHI